LFRFVEPDEVRVGTSEYWWRDGFPLLFEAAATGNAVLFGDVWGFVRCTFRTKPELMVAFGDRIDRALQLCTEGDLTPVLMVMMHIWSYNNQRWCTVDWDHPIVLSARCGHLPAVRLWLAQGIPAQWALSAAVKHGQAEVGSCLIAHGASPLELSPSEQQQLESLLAQPN